MFTITKSYKLSDDVRIRYEVTEQDADDFLNIITQNFTSKEICEFFFYGYGINNLQQKKLSAEDVRAEFAKRGFTSFEVKEEDERERTKHLELKKVIAQMSAAEIAELLALRKK